MAPELPSNSKGPGNGSSRSLYHPHEKEKMMPVTIPAHTTRDQCEQDLREHCRYYAETLGRDNTPEILRALVLRFWVNTGHLFTADALFEVISAYCDLADVHGGNHPVTRERVRCEDQGIYEDELDRAVGYCLDLAIVTADADALEVLA